MQSRKKRRGIIEKRRRDRINTSLSDLRRLVPAACEKQGSAKLEKAEILQMTVDYLKMLHTKGKLRLKTSFIDSFPFYLFFLFRFLFSIWKHFVVGIWKIWWLI